MSRFVIRILAKEQGFLPETFFQYRDRLHYCEWWYAIHVESAAPTTAGHTTTSMSSCINCVASTRQNLESNSGSATSRSLQIYCVQCRLETNTKCPRLLTFNFLNICFQSGISCFVFITFNFQTQCIVQET